MFKKSKAKADRNGTKAEKPVATNHIRAALALRGLSMKAWAKKRGYPLTTVWQAAYGLRAGRTARRIQAELEQLLDA